MNPSRRTIGSMLVLSLILTAEAIASDRTVARRIHAIRFQPSLSAACDVARSRSKDDRPTPVVWLRMLGDLEGFT